MRVLKSLFLFDLRFENSGKTSILHLNMWRIRIFALIFLLAGLGIGYFDYTSQAGTTSRFPFKLGLDLSGGSHLLYEADVSQVDPLEVTASMDALRDVIERRINLFGVSEPLVQVESAGFGDTLSHRLIVELPGVTDVDSAIKMIGQTPVLEFRVQRSDEEITAFKSALDAFNVAQDAGESPEISQALVDGPYKPTELTGRFLDRAVLEFDHTIGEPTVVLEFDKEGADLFEKITEENIGKIVAIYLDGSPISEPVVRDKITGGRAVISGNMTPVEAKELVGRLNSGALPVPIHLLTTQTIGPSLGKETLQAGVIAGIWGIIAVATFLVLWYRLPGIIAVVALGVYIAIMLALFKIIPVTLTAAGIAGFILSVGMAVDANILIFERTKEELRAGRKLREALSEGFARAWLSIRDGNISSIITAVILFWFGTSLVKGFALTFGIGVLVSMLSAITVTRMFLFALSVEGTGRFSKFLFGSGIR